MKSLGCFTTHPCPVSAPLDETGATRLTNAIAHLLTSFKHLMVQYEVASRIRLDPRLVFPVAEAIARLDPTVHDDFNPANEDRSNMDEIHLLLRTMAGCDAPARVYDQCRTTQIDQPFVMTAYTDNRSALIMRLIHVYAWIGEFVRMRGEALHKFQNMTQHPVLRAQFSGFLEWLGRQTGMPLLNEVPIGDATLSRFPREINALIGSYLDVRALSNVQLTQHLVPNSPVSAMADIKRKDEWILNTLTSFAHDPTIIHYESMNRLARWMKRQGYSSDKPLIVNAVRYAQYQPAIRYYMEYLGSFHHAIKFTPDLFYQVVDDFYGDKISILRQLMLPPPLPDQPRFRLTHFGSRDLGWHLWLFSQPEIRPYITLSEETREALMTEARRVMVKSGSAEWERRHAWSTLAWLTSNIYG